MSEWDFIYLDSAKGEWLLDIAAFSQWQIDGHNVTAPKESKKAKELRQLSYNKMRDDVKGLYQNLNSRSQMLPVKTRIRLFSYLAGMSMHQIGKAEIPPVSRQAIHKNLKHAMNGFGLKKARQVWVYYKLYIETRSDKSE